MPDTIQILVYAMLVILLVQHALAHLLLNVVDVMMDTYSLPLLANQDANLDSI